MPPDSSPVLEKRYNAGCPPPARGGDDTSVRPRDLCAALNDIITWLESVRDVVCRLDGTTLPLRKTALRAPGRLARRASKKAQASSRRSSSRRSTRSRRS
jgi:hypothetical protein